MILLWLIATVRYAYLVTEQPLSSLMPWFPYVRWFRKMISIFMGHDEVHLSGSQLMDHIDIVLHMKPNIYNIIMI